jgi:hypothetical protein
MNPYDPPTETSKRQKDENGPPPFSVVVITYGVAAVVAFAAILALLVALL